MSEEKVDELEEFLGDDVVEEKTEKVETKEFKPGVGVDVGTSNIVVSRQAEDGTFVTRFHRNMLYPLDISDEATDLLDRSDYFYITVNGKYYIVGDDALKLVNAIGKGEVIRPMKDGILNPSLQESSELLFLVIKAVVGEPVIKNEPLRFSVPANPADSDLDNLFHEMVLKGFFTQMGYDPQSVNEAMAIAYDCNPIMKSEDDGPMPLTGIVCSCGAGMWNLALALKGLSLVEFSCTKSGDNLDEQVAKVTGMEKGKVIRIKEKKLDLNKIDMSDRVQSALSIYYDEMLGRMVHYICKEFKDQKSELDGEIEIVIAGGTSMAPGFCERLEKVLKKSDFPFDVYQVRHSKTPFYSVSQGSCIRAQADYAKKNK